MQLSGVGINDVYYKKFDDHISMAKPNMFFKNLFFGGMYIDMGGDCACISMKTGCKAKLILHQKVSDQENSRITTEVFDSNGKKQAELSGSWLDEVNFRDLNSGKTEKFWEAGPLVENAYF